MTDPLPGDMTYEEKVCALGSKIHLAHEHHKDMIQAMVDAESRFHTLMDELSDLVDP